MFCFTLKCQQQTQRQRWIGKRAEGGGNHAICQNGATMLTAGVCVNISVGSQVKMTILKYDTREIMAGKKGYISPD